MTDILATMRDIAGHTAWMQCQLTMFSISVINIRKRKQDVVQKAKDDLAAEEEYSDDEEDEEVIIE